MSKPENAGLNPDIRPSLVIPGLTPPYEGIMDEINQEHTSDPFAFLKKVKDTLSQENPSLEVFIKADRTISSIPEYSLKWALVYYEIFSRSGRKASLPLACFVDKKSLRAMGELKIGMIYLIDKEHCIEKIKDQIKKARLKDEEMSDELKKFWRSVDEDKKKLREEYTEEEVESADACLLVFQEVLRAYDNQYDLSARYVNVNPLKDRL